MKMTDKGNFWNYPAQSLPFSEAMKIFKHRLYDEQIPWETRLDAIDRILDMKTFNGITKRELADALCWILEEFRLER